MTFGPIDPSIGARAVIERTKKQQENPLAKVLDILGSKGGQTLVAAGGAGLQAYGQRQSEQAARAQNARQFQAQMAQRQLEGDQQNQLSRSTAAANAAPLGADQEFAQRNAIIKTLLGGARNVNFTPGDSAVASAMGSRTGGISLPEGGLDPAMLERLFGDATTASSIATRAQNVGQINPRMAGPDLNSMFGEEVGAPLTQQVQTANQSELDRQLADSARQRAIIQQAIDEDIKGEKQPKKSGGNIFGKILKGIGTGASFIPGVGQVVAPIATGLGGLVNGDGLKSSLLNAGMSAIPGLAGAGHLGKTAQGLAKNPWAKAILGGR